MQRLNALDDVLLELESDAQPLHLGLVLTFSGPAPDHLALRTLVAARLRGVPAARRRLLRMPWDLGRPVWVDDPQLRPDAHVHHAVLAGAGDDAELGRLVTRVMEGRLDLTRPPWDLWQVDGLTGGRWAVVLQAHHALVDGVTGIDLVQGLLSEYPEDREDGEDRNDSESCQTAARPGPVRHVVETARRRCRPPAALVIALGFALWVAALPVRAACLLAGVLASPGKAMRAAGTVLRGVAQVTRADLPQSPLNGPIGRARRWGWVSIERSEVEPVTEATGCTINDVFLAGLAGGVRKYLLARGESVDPLVVRAIVPTSRRSSGEGCGGGNRVSAMFIELPVQVADPRRRLAEVSRHMTLQKATQVPASTAAVVSLADHIPAPALARAARLYARIGQRRVNLITSNVPGPATPRYLGGHRMLAMIPYVPIAQEIRTAAALVSYAGHVTIGVTGDATALPDLDRLVDEIGAALRELVETCRDA